MTQRCRRIGSRRQNQLGIAQIEQAFFAMTLEHVLGQGQIAPPGRDSRFQLAALLPGQITHRYASQLCQTLDHHRMGGDTAAKPLPGIGISGRINSAPAALAPALKSIEHQDSAVRSVTCAKCQKVLRTA